MGSNCSLKLFLKLMSNTCNIEYFQQLRPSVTTNVFKYRKTVQKKEIDKIDRKDLEGRSNQKYHMYVSETTDRIWYEIDKEGFVASLDK